MTEHTALNDKEDQRKAAVRRHVLWLVGAALGVYATYIAYVFVYTSIN